MILTVLKCTNGLKTGQYKRMRYRVYQRSFQIVITARGVITTKLPTTFSQIITIILSTWG